MATAIELAFRERMKYHGVAVLTLGVFIALLSKGLFTGEEDKLLRSVINAYMTGFILLAVIVTWTVLGAELMKNAWAEVKSAVKGFVTFSGRESLLLVWFITCLVGGAWAAAASHPGAADIGVSAAITALALPEAIILWKRAFARVEP